MRLGPDGSQNPRPDGKPAGITRDDVVQREQIVEKPKPRKPAKGGRR